MEAPACFATRGGQPTPQHLAFVKALGERQLKFDCYWMDAGWYGTSTAACPDVFSGEWWKCGNWRINRLYHPQGLKPVADAVHAAGMKFMLWVDIESASYGVPLTREHPDWFLAKTPGPRQENEGLFLNLGHPEAFAYAIETISDLVRNHGADWYRQDVPISSTGRTSVRDWSWPSAACGVRMRRPCSASRAWPGAGDTASRTPTAGSAARLRPAS